MAGPGYTSTGFTSTGYVTTGTADSTSNIGTFIIHIPDKSIDVQTPQRTIISFLSKKSNDLTV